MVNCKPDMCDEIDTMMSYGLLISRSSFKTSLSGDCVKSDYEPGPIKLDRLATHTNISTE